MLTNRCNSGNLSSMLQKYLWLACVSHHVLHNLIISIKCMHRLAASSFKILIIPVATTKQENLVAFKFEESVNF